MEITIPAYLAYAIDRVNFDQMMVINQMVFMLTHHANDIDDNFLESETFKDLHKDLVMTTAQKWCSEITIVKKILGYIPNNYSIDMKTAKILIG